MRKVAVVTGGSSGIGLCTAKSLRESDCTVYEISRRASDQKGVVHVPCDVTDRDAMAAAIRDIAQKEGRLDILVCNAGMGISGAVEFTDPKDARYLMDVNFFGLVNAVDAALPLMRAQKSGRIVLVSSVAAALPIPFQTYYSVSKAAINAFALALRNEVRCFGISICAVMPGDIKTGFTEARRKKPYRRRCVLRENRLFRQFHGKGRAKRYGSGYSRKVFSKSRSEK